MIAAWLVAVAAANCPAPVPLEPWVDTLGAAERAYASLDRVAFADSLDAATLDLPCLAATVTRVDAARYHVLNGLRLYVAGEADRARTSFAAARAADPWYVLPEVLVPTGHEIRWLFDSASPGSTSPIALPADAAVWIDGAPADRRPDTRPAIVQVVKSDGGVAATAYVLPGDPLPITEAPAVVSVVPVPVAPAPAPVAPAPVEPTPRGPGGQPKWPFLAAGGVAAGTGAVLYALGASSAAKFAGPLPEDEFGPNEVAALRKRTNALVVSSGIAGAIAAGGVTLFVVSL